MTKNTTKIAVRLWLTEREKTQGWLAEKVGISAAHLSDVLNGAERPSAEVRKAIKRITGVDVMPTEAHQEVTS